MTFVMQSCNVMELNDVRQGVDGVAVARCRIALLTFLPLRLGISRHTGFILE